MKDGQWWDESWSPISGCTPVSEGCRFCWAKRMSKRLKGRYGYPADDPFKVTFHPDKVNGPLRWRKPRRIFVCSMSDFNHPDVEWNWQYKIIETMFVNPDHTYMVLTKRPEGFGKRLDDIYFHIGRNYGLNWDSGKAENYPFPLKNLWLGVTAENQQRADERIPILLQIPAAVRFVSFEPLLSRIKAAKYAPKLDWAIIGCESGAGRRQTDVDWIIDLKDTFVVYDKPVFIKQAEIAGKLIKMPKIDGREWNEYPKG
ncbi:MAG TPA: DUF5131 family protein [Desulfobacterales bacterium]|nr:DUF5131 family protein [Desulfobacterales bacterium]